MKIRNIFLSAAALGAMASCSGFLDDMPDTRVELKTTEHARLLMNNAYPDANYGWLCEVMSDNIVDNNSPAEDGMRYNLLPYDKGDEEMYRWEVNKTSTDSDSPSSVWQAYYRSIASANECIQLLEKLQAEQDGKLTEEQSALMGEALVLRSYCHFTLAQIFCMPYRGQELSKSELGLPYMTKPETLVKPMYDRGDLASFYQKVQEDLENGLPLINNVIFEQPKYHFNRTAAHAYASRFYLITRDYQKCLDHCNFAFGGEEVDPSTILTRVYAQTFFNSTDFTEYNQVSTNSHNFLLLPTHSIQPRRMMQKRFACNRDALESTLQCPGPTWTKYTWHSSSGAGKSYYMNVCYRGKTYYSGKQEYGFFFPGNMCERFEYTNKVAGIGYAHITRSEFTSEEVLLNRAEAYLFLGQRDKALKDLQTWEEVRRDNSTQNAGSENYYYDWSEQRVVEFYSQVPGEGTLTPAGIAKTIHLDEVYPCEYSVTADILPILQCIQHFRRMEFVHTGMRWFDVKRFGFEYDHAFGRSEVYHLDVMDSRKAVQIPPEVVAAGFQENPRASEPVEQMTSSMHVGTLVGK